MNLEISNQALKSSYSPAVSYYIVFLEFSERRENHEKEHNHSHFFICPFSYYGYVFCWIL